MNPKLVSRDVRPKMSAPSRRTVACVKRVPTRATDRVSVPGGVRSLRVWASYLDRTQEIDIPSLRALLHPTRMSVTRRLRRRSRETARGAGAPVVSR